MKKKIGLFVGSSFVLALAAASCLYDEPKDMEGMGGHTAQPGQVTYCDSDGDGWSPCNTECVSPAHINAGECDCDDAVANINPGADEVCDNADNDCDGAADDDNACVPGEPQPTPDNCDPDGDGNRSCTLGSCVSQYERDNHLCDCHDGDASIHSGAPAKCNTIDGNCSGSNADEQMMCGEGGHTTTGPEPDYDLDNDGYVDQAHGGPDCNDNDNSVHPGAPLVCGSDKNCNGMSDETAACGGTGSSSSSSTSGTMSSSSSSSGGTGCPDNDGDGYTSKLCGGTDCDDYVQTIHPNAGEVCGNNADDDCDGSTDEDCQNQSVMRTVTWELNFSGLALSTSANASGNIIAKIFGEVKAPGSSQATGTWSSQTPWDDAAFCEPQSLGGNVFTCTKSFLDSSQITFNTYRYDPACDENDGWWGGDNCDWPCAAGNGKGQAWVSANETSPTVTNGSIVVKVDGVVKMLQKVGNTDAYQCTNNFTFQVKNVPSP